MRMSSTPLPLKDRLGTKLAAIFVVTFLVVTVGALIYEMLYSLGESALLESVASAQAPVTTIDPKIESELAKALAFEALPMTADIRDPFSDQAGLSGQKASAATVATVAANRGPATVAANNPAAPASVQGGAYRVAGQPGTNAPSAPAVPQSTTLSRLQLREEQLRAGSDPGPESTAYSIADLLPVGVVSGGNGQEEIMFYCEAVDRTVSFPVGTRFYDGWLLALKPEGVVFGIDDQYRTTRLRSWGRSIRSRSSGNISALVPTLGTGLNAGSN